MVASRFPQHVGDEFRSDGRPGFVFFVLAGIREMGDDGSDSACGRNLASARAIGFSPTLQA